MARGHDCRRSLGHTGVVWIMAYGFGLWAALMPFHAMPALPCAALALPITRLLQAINTPSTQMRLADIVCQPSMVPLWIMEAGRNIRRHIIGCSISQRRFEGSKLRLYYSTGLIPLAQKAAFFLRTISSTIMARPTVQEGLSTLCSIGRLESG
jgi:hypothetical protein